MRLHADIGGLLHQRNFIGRFEEPQLIQQMAQFQKLLRRLRALPHLRAHTVDPANQLEIKLGIAPKVVMHTPAAFQQAGQDVVDIGNRVGIIQPECIYRAFWSQPWPIPTFTLQIALAAK